MTDEKTPDTKKDKDLFQLSNHNEPISTLSADERLATLDGKTSGSATQAVAEIERLRHKVATYIEDARYYHRRWQRQGELNLDATQEIKRLRQALAECEAEIDLYIDYRYPLYTHPVYDQKNRNAKEANPARLALQENT